VRRMNATMRTLLSVPFAIGSTAALAQQAAPSPEATPTAPAASTPAATPTPAAAAAAPATAQPAGKSGFEAWNQKTKQPTKWWKWGADLRIRDEFIDKSMTLASIAGNPPAPVPRYKQNWVRFRARWWNTVTPTPGFDFNVRLTIESRDWTETSFSAPNHKGWDWNEIVFDHFNVKIKPSKTTPLTFTIGRQDLMFGDNWLIFEGTPLDGSRTIYFDAARSTFEIKKWKTTFDAIFIDQTARNDWWLPPMRVSGDDVNGVRLPIQKAQVEHNERGLVLYMTDKAKPTRQIDAYFIYRAARREPIRVANSTGATAPFVIVTNPDDVDDPNMKTNLGRGEDSDLYTVGGRLGGDLGKGDVSKLLKYRVEAAFQTGKRNGIDQRGYGVNSALTYAPKTKLGHQFRLQYELLSGDDPNTKDRDEGFDILWGRWPRWSELYIYTYAAETTRIAQLGNLHRIGAGWTFKPFAKAELATDLYRLYADKDTAKVRILSGAGKTRGTLLTSKLLMKFTPHLAGHLWFERFWPGNYYGADRREAATFIRPEVAFTW
jgi:hypothetical protein